MVKSSPSRSGSSGPPRRSRDGRAPASPCGSSVRWRVSPRASTGCASTSRCATASWLAAYALAQRALDLDPGAWQGWSTLGLHLVFDRSSAEVERDPAERRRWIAAGLDVLEQGTRVARRPEELRLAQGLVLAGFVAPRAEELAWPGGGEAARELGHPRAAGLAAAALEDLASLRRGERPRGW